MKILLLRGGALGDLVLTFPALEALADVAGEIEFWGAFPHAGLVRFLGIERISDLQGRDALWIFQRPIASPPRPLHFDLAISYLYDAEGLIEANLRQAGVKEVVVGPHHMQPGRHASDQLLEPVRSIAMPEPMTGVRRLAGRGQRTGDQVRAKIRSQAGERHRPIALHPGSGSAGKNWPIDRWIELSGRLNDAGERLVLIAGEADDGPVERFLSAARSLPVTLVRNRPLDEVVHVLADCRLLIGQDSGISHLAAWLGVPVVALFGLTDPEIWAPRGADVKVLRAPNGRMEALDVASVMHYARR
jgi:ADP-heptose:LPS heptosyltransferase